MEKYKVWGEVGEPFEEYEWTDSFGKDHYKQPSYELADIIGCDCEDRDGRDVQVVVEIEDTENGDYDKIVTELKAKFLAEAERLNVDPNPDHFDWSEIDKVRP